MRELILELTKRGPDEDVYIEFDSGWDLLDSVDGFTHSPDDGLPQKATLLR